MTFDETLALLNWASEHNAQNVQIGEVAVVFAPKAQRESAASQVGLSPHETRKQLDQMLFGADLEQIG